MTHSCPLTCRVVFVLIPRAPLPPPPSSEYMALSALLSVSQSQGAATPPFSCLVSTHQPGSVSCNLSQTGLVSCVNALSALFGCVRMRGVVSVCMFFLCMHVICKMYIYNIQRGKAFSFCETLRMKFLHFRFLLFVIQEPRYFVGSFMLCLGKGCLNRYGHNSL